MKAPLMAGRQFADADRMDAPAVCIVDQEMVNRYWPHTDPIGKRVTFSSTTAPNIQWITVVGVVGHLAHEGLDAQKRVQLYLPLAQNPRALMGFTVRTVGDPLAATATIRRAVASVDPDLPLAAPASMETLVDASLGSRRFAMLLLGGFALLSLVLASIGLYGVMSYTVTQRAREMGVRLALGAGTGDVLGLVLRQGVNLTLLGVGIGIAAAFALTRVMKTMLFGVGATDPLTFVTLPLVLLAVALLATYLPARRATRTDPIVALRAE
jgi:putative ABC transport system permease protein